MVQWAKVLVTKPDDLGTHMAKRIVTATFSHGTPASVQPVTCRSCEGKGLVGTESWGGARQLAAF